MKLRNKKTGEIIELLAKPSFIKRNDDYLQSEVNTFSSLAELNEEWEDVPEEPKEYWIIDTILHEIRFLPYKNNEEDKRYEQWLEELGLKFETEEEAEKAVEKLKAWKRLNDAGVSFKPTTIGHKWYLEPHASPENRTFKESQDLYKDVMLFFGGEDDKK